MLRDLNRIAVSFTTTYGNIVYYFVVVGEDAIKGMPKCYASGICSFRKTVYNDKYVKSSLHSGSKRESRVRAKNASLGCRVAFNANMTGSLIRNATKTPENLRSLRCLGHTILQIPLQTSSNQGGKSQTTSPPTLYIHINLKPTKHYSQSSSKTVEKSFLFASVSFSYCEPIIPFQSLLLLLTAKIFNNSVM